MELTIKAVGPEELHLINRMPLYLRKFFKLHSRHTIFSFGQ
jgi:hypothetical protein